jgi:hypothetical protein
MRNPTFKFLVVSSLSLGISTVFTKAAVFKEVGGQVLC